MMLCHQVQYVDYGLVENIPVVHVYPMLLCVEVPQLCMPCQLFGINPVRMPLVLFVFLFACFVSLCLLQSFYVWTVRLVGNGNETE